LLRPQTRISLQIELILIFSRSGINKSLLKVNAKVAVIGKDNKKNAAVVSVAEQLNLPALDTMFDAINQKVDFVLVVEPYEQMHLQEISTRHCASFARHPPLSQCLIYPLFQYIQLLEMLRKRKQRKRRNRRENLLRTKKKMMMITTMKMNMMKMIKKRRRSLLRAPKAARANGPERYLGVRSGVISCKDHLILDAGMFPKFPNNDFQAPGETYDPVLRPPLSTQIWRESAFSDD
jgi:hypothetical protein